MDDDHNKPEEEPAEPARDAAQEEGAKFREVTEPPAVIVTGITDSFSLRMRSTTGRPQL
jgi:hypothetical protein